jgi:glycosyltransferase involved in cell wall biosynthesis
LKISYGITVHNEAAELNKLLGILIHKTDVEDEIVICVDGDDKEVDKVITSWVQQYASDDVDKIKDIIVYNRKLDGNFAAHKNSVIEKSSGDYIFHIDADEYPNETLLEQLKQIIEMNDGVDLIWIPRVNTVEGMTQEHIQKWGWRVTENGWVNYPDYQARVFRRDKSIRWTRPLHEVITGCKTYSHLPPYEELSLYHPKTIQKQEQQNMFYIDNFSKDLLVRKGQ